jgi:hypothetical protein
VNLAACGALPFGPETGTWFRAVQLQHLPTAFQTSHTKHFPSRFNEGPRAVQPFEVFYAAQDHQVALFEVQALLGSPYWPQGAPLVVPNPNQNWVVLCVQVQLQHVADLTQAAEQVMLQTSAQELTGDWQGYQYRQPQDTVNQPVGAAPTQALGQAPFTLPGLEGFRAVSARVPNRMNLVVFPQRLLPGSSLTVYHNGRAIHRIVGRRRRRKSPY